MPKTPPPKIMTPDQQLAEHLEKAEEHLIAAVKLFSRKTAPDRHRDYLPRLVRAQESVTTLFREELVRIRGPIRVRTK
jgi:hypothetical protein